LDKGSTHQDEPHGDEEDLSGTRTAHRDDFSKNIQIRDWRIDLAGKYMPVV